MLNTGARRIPRALVASANPETRRKQRKLNPRQKGEVKRIVRFGRELKFKTIQVNRNSVSNTPTILDLTNIIQGNTDSDRNGDRIELAGSMDVILTLFGSESVLTTGFITTIFRVIFFQYKDAATAGLNPVAGQILLNGPSGLTPDVHSLYNHDQRQNYTILYDKLVTCVNNSNPVAVAGTNYQGNHLHSYKFKVHFKKAKKLVSFLGGTVDGTNKIYFMIISDNGPVTPLPQYTLNTKLYYRDS